MVKYGYDDEKGKRVKIPRLTILKNRQLMLTFLLGIYDGDGSLGLNKYVGGKMTISPNIVSSDKGFLIQLKDYFDLKYELYLHSYEKYDFKKEPI